jgi:hypothetical protein
MGIEQHSTEVRWGTDGSEIIIGVNCRLPDVVIKKIIDYDVPVSVYPPGPDGHDLIGYDKEVILSQGVSPLDLVGRQVLDPLREHHKDRNLGRVLFDPRLRDIERNGSLFPAEKDAKEQTQE